MNLEEFLKTIYYTSNYIVIPILDRARIDKKQFLVKGKYNLNKEKEYLEKVFELNKHKLK